MLLSDEYVRAVLGEVDETDLSLESHRLIFRAVRTLHAAGEVVDYVTVKDHIRGLHLLRLVGGPSGILDLLGFAGEWVPIAYHVKVIKGEG